MRASEEQLRVLMLGGLSGDGRAYRNLLDLLAPMLRSFFGRRLRDAADDVEDLVQETLIAIHTRRATYDTLRPFTAWAYAVARHKLVDHYRRRRVHVPVDDLQEILSVEGFEDISGAQMDIDRLLGLLPAKQARAIRDTKIDGLSVGESAARNDMSESDVKVSVHRGLKALMARMVKP